MLFNEGSPSGGRGEGKRTFGQQYPFTRQNEPVPQGYPSEQQESPMLAS